MEKHYQVWQEGFAATGGSCEGSFIGETKANSFDEAVIKLYGRKLDMEEDNPKEYRRLGGRLCSWAMRFYDNESDARKDFG